MNIKNVKIMAILEAWEKQKKSAEDGGRLPGITLPAKIAWTRRVNLERLSDARGLIQKALAEIQQDYADDTHSEPAGENGERRVKNEFVGEFLRAQAEILAQETDVQIKMVSIDDLASLDLTEADLDTLAFMIEE